MTYEEILKAQEGLTTQPVKGKDYVMVNERVKAFRKLCPNGTIKTDIMEDKDGRCTVRARVYDEEGNMLASGHAYEKEESSFINKTSYIENCETSAVGRALGFLGIGIDGGIASAEEVENAINNQKAPQKTSDKKITEGLYKEILGLIAQKYTSEENQKGYIKKLEDYFEKPLKDISITQYEALKGKLTA